jgi:uncharacterized membrane protein
MFCHHCGAQIADDSQFCTGCGKSLSGPGALAPPLPAVWIAPKGVESRTGRWLSAGWDMVVKQDLGIFFLMALVISILTSAVPLILQGPLMAGMHIYCMKKLMGRRAEFGDLFKGFNFFIPTLAACLVITCFTLLGLIGLIIPGLVLAAMYQFTYLFIVDKGMDFWQAMKASHAIVKQDYLGFTGFFLAMIGVDIVGALCCFFGLYIAFPITMAATTVAYHEIVGIDPRTVDAL